MASSLSPTRGEQVQHLFDEVADLDAERCAAYLDLTCRDDPDLRREVEALLRVHGRVDDILSPYEQFLLAPPEDEAEEEPLTDPYQLVGQTLSHYEIEEKLGAGGMGVVYKAHDIKLDRTVALKFLPPYLSMNVEAKVRFTHEAKAASALDHPNICTIYDIDETEAGQLFIAMAFYEGETLKKKIARGSLLVEEALDYAVQVAEGLSRAHEAGIVHRDVKPANVMVTERGLVKIVDFGLAKMADVSLTQTGTTLGTVAYMSPEQAMGGEVDHRTDLWSLGVVLYEMLTGERPFRGDYAEAILYAIRHDAPRSLRALRPEAPETLERVVEKTLAKSPDERYQHAKEMLVDLGTPQRAPETTLPAARPASAPPSRRHRAMLYGGMAVLALLVAVAGYVLFIGGRAPIDSIAVLPLDNLSGDPDQEYFADGMTEELITTLNKIEALPTIGRRSVMSFKGSNQQISEIARILGVTHVVDGSVLQVKDSVRIIVNLYAAASDVPLWSERFTHGTRYAMSLQQEVARAIADAIEIRVTPQDETRLGEAKEIDPEAYKLYLLGRYYRFQGNKESLEQAISKFEQAITIAPDFALAYAGLSVANYLSGVSGGRPFEEGRSNAIRAVEQALRLDENLPEAHIAVGIMKQRFEWDWDGAKRALRRAVALNPGNWEAHFESGYLMLRTERYAEGSDEMKQALALDPLSIQAHEGVAMAYVLRKQYDEAIDVIGKARELDPNCCRYELGWAYLQMGRVEEAIAEFENMNRFGPLGLGSLGHAYGVAGRREEALQVLDELREHDAGPSYIAMIYTGLGEKDQALDWLERAVEEHRVTITIKVRPAFASLHAEPRFQVLMNKMGLDERPR